MAVLADLPMTELKAKRAPMVMLVGRAACMATGKTVQRQSSRRRRVVADDAIT